MALTPLLSLRSWQSESSKPVKTFSIGFEEERYSETFYARQIADRYHTDHHEFVFRAKDLSGASMSRSPPVDEPLADPAALPLLELSRQARQSVTVALCGDGGDETLAGYRRYAHRWPASALCCAARLADAKRRPGADALRAGTDAGYQKTVILLPG